MGKVSIKKKLFKVEEIEHLAIEMPDGIKLSAKVWNCLLYTSDAADE